MYGCFYLIKRKQTKTKKKETKIERQTKTGTRKKQRIDERKHSN